jgi:hypothetical protein
VSVERTQPSSKFGRFDEPLQVHVVVHKRHGSILDFRLAGIQRWHQNCLGVPSSGNPQPKKKKIDELLNVPYSLILLVFVRFLTQS